MYRQLRQRSAVAFLLIAALLLGGLPLATAGAAAAPGVTAGAVAYVHSEVDADGNWSDNLYLRTASAAPVKVLSNIAYQQQRPTWSPDGGKLAAITLKPIDTPDGLGGTAAVLSVLTVATGVVTEVAQGSAAESFNGFAWSLDGSQLAYGLLGEDRGDIFAVSSTGGVSVNLTNNESNVYDMDPSWGPAGVAFTRNAGDAKPQIFAMAADGSNAHRLSPDDRIGYHLPVWSPDGTKLTVYADDWRNPADAEEYLPAQLLELASDSNAAPLSLGNIARGSWVSPAVWAPDGSRVYATTSQGGQAISARAVSSSNLYSYSATAQGAPKLLVENARDASVSSDGKTLAYSESNNIGLTSGDGAKQLNLTASGDYESLAAIRPGTFTVKFPTPPPPPPQFGQVTGVTAAVSSTTALWNLDVTVAVQNVSCPATLIINFGSWQKRPTVCGAGETAPAEFKFKWKVFDASHSLPAGQTVQVSAYLARSTAPRYEGADKTVDVPVRPIVVGTGDSYLSGHRQLADESRCALPEDAAAPCQPQTYEPNDSRFSWVSRMTSKLNKNVPEGWQYQLSLLARSGATTQTMFHEGQIAAMVESLQQHPGSWNVVDFDGGANNADFTRALSEFYRQHNGVPNIFPLAPWAVKKWGYCPDMQGIYARLMAEKPTIEADLVELIRRAREASGTVRFLDMLYPFVLKTDNVCSQDRQIPTDPSDPSIFTIWRGAKSIVDELDSIHAGLLGDDIARMDLREVFGSSPLSKLQLTRNYGYPHPQDTGQEQMGNRAARILLHP